MPTTRVKNALYRIMLPFLAPHCSASPVSSVSGHAIRDMESFVRIIRKRHVLGSSTLIESGSNWSLICTSSDLPAHAAQTDTVYRVASITKTATAILTMRLADLHLLDPDSPVSDFFTSEAAKSSLHGITLRHLLSHTSGLVDPPGLETALENGIPFPELLQNVRLFSPGDAFHYSNLGFGLIGCVMESVLHCPVGVIFRNYLFSPLNMNATLEGCLLPRETIMPVTRILPYRKGSDLVITKLGSVPLTSEDPLRHYGHTAGSMYTDIFSLRKLFHVLTNKDVSFLSEAAVNQMKREHASYGPVSPSLSYGLGLLRINDPSISEHCIYGHQGFAYGCVDGAFWEEDTGNMLITLNGGCCEARSGRLGISNRDFMRWAFRKELPLW